MFLKELSINQLLNKKKRVLKRLGISILKLNNPKIYSKTSWSSFNKSYNLHNNKNHTFPIAANQFHSITEKANKTQLKINITSNNYDKSRVLKLKVFLKFI